jgi:hypothetical protein
MQNDIVGIVIGIAGIFIGVIVSYYFYRKSLRVKGLCFSIKTENFIEGYSTRFNDLTIRYKDKEIENLSVSKVLFWNNGNETIDRDDILTAFPLHIFAVDDVEILDVKVLDSNNVASRFTSSLSEDGKSAYLSFDYLDSQQGAVIQVIHTGTSPLSVYIHGHVKGVKEISYKEVERGRGFLFISMSVFNLSLLWILCILSVFDYFRTRSIELLNIIFMTAAPAFTIFSLIIYMRQIRYQAKAPKGLGDYFDKKR